MAEPAPLLSLRRHALVGVCAIAVFALLLGGWAGTTEIAGAVIASGNIVPEEGTKAVQHPEGGVVAEILVKDGDAVTAGQLLVRLDSTTVAANLQVVVSQLSEALALQARLTAESTGETAVSRPAALDDWPERDKLDELFAAQDRLRQSRAAAQAGLAAQLQEQISQLGEQIEGVEAQRQAVDEEVAILTAESADTAALYKQGLVQVARVNDDQRELARLRGETGNLTAQIAGLRTAIAERRTQIAQNIDKFQSQVLEDLRTAGLQISELLQQKIAAEDRLARLEIRAPQSGVIHQSIVRTVGGVVGAGETLMSVVPQSSALAVETRVSPLDIDKLSLGQAVSVRLTGLDVRTTPELAATVESISPDLTKDPATGVSFYQVRVALPPSELARLPHGQHLVPGMPAEAFMRTADRTVLSYLVGPMAAQLSRVFRED